jgi:hypothetical protein
MNRITYYHSYGFLACFNISPRAPIYTTHLNSWDNEVYVAIGTLYGLLYKVYIALRSNHNIGLALPSRLHSYMYMYLFFYPLCRFGLKRLDRLMYNFILLITCKYTRESERKSWGRGGGHRKNQILRRSQSRRITQLSKSYGVTQCSVRSAEYFRKVCCRSIRRSAGQVLRRSRMYSAAKERSCSPLRFT